MSNRLRLLCVASALVTLTIWAVVCCAYFDWFRFWCGMFVLMFIHGVCWLTIDCVIWHRTRNIIPAREIV